MGLNIANLQVITSCLSRMREDVSTPLKMLTLGYQDFVTTPDTLDQLFHAGFSQNLKERPEALQTRWEQEGYRVFDINDFGQKVNVEIVAIDVVKLQGEELVVDLNQPIDPMFHGAFDLVFDGGTIEHCFNIGQAISNAASCVKQNGFIVHNNPLNKINHGFFNLCPTFYYDFYSQNGFQPLLIKACTKGRDEAQLIAIDAVSRVPVPQEELSIVSVAQRQEMRDFQWPIQTKYKDMLA